jgi:hypothetical protein
MLLNLPEQKKILKQGSILWNGLLPGQRDMDSKGRDGADFVEFGFRNI